MTAIRIEKLGKRYKLGLTHARSIRELVNRSMDRLLRRGPQTQPLETPSAEGTVDEEGMFWALRDASLDVQQGDVIGLIGRNGAGKSTLLKLLTRITSPTEGRAEIRGRVGSLLEVGTGFHPELSGRENVFLNGAILGMTKTEIRQKLDEIVAFSEIEQFIDTPVKRYSSGMYVRLAFAVAAHLEPEVLLVDEVLAVGDAEFQKKCLGKMRDVSRHGRTIVFVSHNMDAIKRLCNRGVWLDKGRVRFLGSAEECVSQYLSSELRGGGRAEFDPALEMPNGMPVRIGAVQVADAQQTIKQRFSAAEPIHVRIEWELCERLYKPRIGFVLATSDATEVFTAMDANSWEREWLDPGRYVSECVIPGRLLNEGGYILNLSGDTPRKYGFRKGFTGGLLQFDVEDDMTFPGKYYGEEGFRDSRWPGLFLPHLSWKQERNDAGTS